MCRRAIFVAAFLLLASAIPVSAAEDDPLIFFKEEGRVLILELLRRLDVAENSCNGSDCDNFYFFEYIGTGDTPLLPKVERGEVFADNNLRLTLNQSLKSLDSIRLVLRKVKFLRDDKPKRQEFLVGPLAYLDPESRNGIVYQTVFPRKDPPRAEDVKVTVTLKNEETDQEKDFPVTVQGVEPYRLSGNPDNARPEGEVLWIVLIEPPLPRGTTASVSVSGFDEGLTAEAEGEVEGFPKGRDDANVYLRGQKVYNQKGDDEGSVDIKLERSFFSSAKERDWWYLIEATVGSASLDISQSGTASVGRRWWLNIDPNKPRKTIWAFSVAPTFRTDRDFDNRDLGVDLTLESKPGKLYRPLEVKRRDDPESQVGWWLVPKFGIESGWHLASSSDQVDGENFERALASVNFMWETDDLLLTFDALRLTVDVAARYLAEDEVTINEDEVLEIKDGYKPYLRAELAYDFGMVALSVVHENGKLPPAFKTARATTVGLTFKF